MKNTFIIGIAGGTASGKSTFTRRLKERFKKSVVVLHHDDYYRDQTEIAPEERKKINYDHPDSLDTELLLSHLAMLGNLRPSGRTERHRLYYRRRQRVEI